MRKKLGDGATTVSGNRVYEGRDLEDVRVAGGSIIDDKPIFSLDSKHIFVISGGLVLVYSTASGELAHVLQSDEPIVAICLDSSNQRRVVTCDKKCNVLIWDYQIETSLKKQSFAELLTDGRGRTPVGLFLPNGVDEPAFLLASASGAAAGDSQALQTPGRPTDGSSETSAELLITGDRPGVVYAVLVGVRRGISGHWEVGYGDQNSIVAGIVRPNRIFVRPTWRRGHQMNKNYSSLWTDEQRPFTCLSVHPFERTLAAGDTTGRIHLYQGIQFTRGKPPVHAIFHWHTLPLPSIAFSHEGTYLISGGEECVLVVWQLQGGQKQYLPRLGMPIRHVQVSSDNQLITTSHADNMIRLVTPQREVAQIVRSLSWGVGGPPATGLVHDPRTGALLLNGSVGHLQLYSTHEKRDLYSMDIVQTNYLTRERTGSLVTCDVTRVTVTSDGGWMATVEARDDGKTAAECRLKFWHFDTTKQTHVLNTCVDDPHDGTVTSLAFRPHTEDKRSAPLAVTTGTDGAVKYWRLVDDSDIYGEKMCWNCDCTGSHRGLTASCAAFSPDGSQLAVGFGHAVTLWQPDRNQTKATLSNVQLRDAIRQVAFGRDTCCHLLVARTDSGLQFWNTQTETLSGRISLRVTHLAADPCSEYMAAFSANNKVFIFRPVSCRPVHQAALVRPVACACFVPHRTPRPDLPPWQQHSQLYYLTDQQSLHTLGRPAEDARLERVSTAVTSGHGPVTPFSALVAEQRRSAVTPGEPRSRSEVTPGLEQMLEVLNAPSHTLPPLTNICSTLLEAMLYPLPQSSDEDTAVETKPALPAPSDENGASQPPGDTDAPADSQFEARLNQLLSVDFSWLCT